MSEGDAESVFDNVRVFLLSYNFLAKDSYENERGHYNMTIKFHFAWHLAYHARWLNPKSSWCYKYENFVGLLQQMGQSCTHGTPMWSIPQKLIDNYLRLLSIRVARLA